MEKKPRLFYMEEAVGAWIPAPDHIDNIFDVNDLLDGEEFGIQFKRFDMTDEEFDSLPEG